MPSLCPQITFKGLCGDTGCRFSHNAHICEVCWVICSSTDGLAAHEAGRVHRTAIVELGGRTMPSYPANGVCPLCQAKIDGGKNWVGHFFYLCPKGVRSQRPGAKPLPPFPSNGLCETCRVIIPTIPSWFSHVTGAHHLRVESGNNTNVAKGMILCQLCNIQVPGNLWSQHSTGARHLKTIQSVIQHELIRQCAEDKNSVTLDGNTDFGIIESDDSSIHSHEFVLKTSAPSINVTELKLASTTEAGSP
jgi:hypothetical protein